MNDNSCSAHINEKQPLIMMTLEPFDPTPPTVGYYNEETDTWSIRDWQSVHASPKKINEER